MGTMRKKHPVAFKTKVALKIIGEEKTSAELDWFKKMWTLTVNVKEEVMSIEREGNIISVRRQAELLGIARSILYYEPVIDTCALGTDEI